jgi:hypothetical protein
MGAASSVTKPPMGKSDSMRINSRRAMLEQRAANTAHIESNLSLSIETASPSSGRSGNGSSRSDSFITPAASSASNLDDSESTSVIHSDAHSNILKYFRVLDSMEDLKSPSSAARDRNAFNRAMSNDLFVSPSNSPEKPESKPQKSIQHQAKPPTPTGRLSGSGWTCTQSVPEEEEETGNTVTLVQPFSYTSQHYAQEPTSTMSESCTPIRAAGNKEQDHGYNMQTCQICRSGLIEIGSRCVLCFVLL